MNPLKWKGRGGNYCYFNGILVGEVWFNSFFNDYNVMTARSMDGIRTTHEHAMTKEEAKLGVEKRITAMLQYEVEDALTREFNKEAKFR